MGGGCWWFPGESGSSKIHLLSVPPVLLLGFPRQVDSKVTVGPGDKDGQGSCPTAVGKLQPPELYTHLSWSFVSR